MKTTDIERFRLQLLKLCQRTRPEIERMRETVLHGEHAIGEHDQGVSESLAKEAYLENNEEEIHRAAFKALHRLEAGTFGICQSCGCEIPRARLVAIPFTPYCVSCEAEREL